LVMSYVFHYKQIKNEYTHLKKAFLKDIDQGESEAIVLALQESADLILLDEYDARELARNHDLRITGVIGVLMKANKMGKIDDLRKHLDALRSSGFWINDILYDKVCKIGDK